MAVICVLFYKTPAGRWGTNIIMSLSSKSAVRFATAVKLSSRDLTHISLKTRQTLKDMSHKTLTKSAIQLLLSKKLFSFTLKVKQIFVSWFICEIDFYESKVKGLNQSAQHSCRCSLQLCKPALSGRRMISSLTAVASDNSVRSTSFRVIWFYSSQIFDLILQLTGCQ